MKHRAVSKLIKSWPKSPKKRTEGVSAYLTTVARRYFVVDKKKRLLDKLVELLKFYIEIKFVKFIVFH
jgi:hypothetical protein